MYLKILIPTLFAFNVYSTTIDVQYKLKSFHIIYDQNQLTYKDTLVYLTLKNKPCINESYLALKNNLDNYMAKEFHGTKDKHIMKVVYNGTAHYELNTTNRSEFLLNTLDEIKKIKTEEEIGCNK